MLEQPDDAPANSLVWLLAGGSLQCVPVAQSGRRAPRPTLWLLDDLAPEILHLAPEILHLLGDGPLQFDAVLDWICERAGTDDEWLASHMQDPDNRRRSLGWDLELLTCILVWAGIAERLGATTEPDRYDASRERLVGGTLQLTPVGHWCWPRVPDRQDVSTSSVTSPIVRAASGPRR